MPVISISLNLKIASVLLLTVFLNIVMLNAYRLIKKKKKRISIEAVY